MKIYVTGKLNRRAALSVLKCARPVRRKGSAHLILKCPAPGSPIGSLQASSSAENLPSFDEIPAAASEINTPAPAKKPKVKGGHLRSMINYSDRF